VRRRPLHPRATGMDFLTRQQTLEAARQSRAAQRQRVAAEAASPASASTAGVRSEQALHRTSERLHSSHTAASSGKVASPRGDRDVVPVSRMGAMEGGLFALALRDAAESVDVVPSSSSGKRLGTSPTGKRTVEAARAAEVHHELFQVRAFRKRARERTKLTMRLEALHTGLDPPVRRRRRRSARRSERSGRRQRHSGRAVSRARGCPPHQCRSTCAACASSWTRRR